MSQSQGGRRGVVDAALLLVAITWGSSYLAAQEVATTDNVVGFLVLRFGAAVVFFAILLAPRLRHISRTEVRLGALYGLVLAVILVLETYGVTQTTASNAGLIISLTMLLTPILESSISGRRLPGQFYLAALVAVVGVGLLSQSGGFAPPRSGDLLILGAAVARAVHVTVISRTGVSRRAGTGRTVRTR